MWSSPPTYALCALACRMCLCRPVSDLGGTTMIANDYEAAVVVLLGTAADIIRGATKGILVDDAPNQDWRTLVLDDSE